MRFVYFLALLVSSLPMQVTADTTNAEIDKCKNPPDMATMTECSQLGYEVAEKALKNIYQQLLSKIDSSYPAGSGSGADDKKFNDGYKESLKASQDAWIKFRDADCYFSNYDRTGGSSQLMNIYDCKADLTNMRIKELKGIIQDF